MSARTLIDEILSRHHAFLRREIPVIAAMVRGYAPQMKSRGDWSGLEAAFREIENELGHHLSKEEAMLFPAICHIEDALERGERPDLTRYDIRESLAQAETEHDQSGHALQNLMKAAGCLEQQGACLDLIARLKALRDDLHEHEGKEENGLFPEARLLYAKATRGTLREE